MKALFLALCLMAVSTYSLAECYSDGVRVGQIQKFSQKGFINKSWEGELVLEGMKFKSNAQGASGGNVWKFSVLDASVASAINDAVMSGNPVALKYCQVVFTGFQSDTGYRVTQVVERKAK